ncbi:MAG: hypothetical protein VX568_06135, partial [Actinomycetota bacterium]|nr:hypothetical protein [Actinomycetota bacterium]
AEVLGDVRLIVPPARAHSDGIITDDDLVTDDDAINAEIVYNDLLGEWEFAPDHRVALRKPWSSQLRTIDVNSAFLRATIAEDIFCPEPQDLTFSLDYAEEAMDDNDFEYFDSGVEPGVRTGVHTVDVQQAFHHVPVVNGVPGVCTKKPYDSNTNNDAINDQTVFNDLTGEWELAPDDWDAPREPQSPQQQPDHAAINLSMPHTDGHTDDTGAAFCDRGITDDDAINAEIVYNDLSGEWEFAPDHQNDHPNMPPNLFEAKQIQQFRNGVCVWPFCKRQAPAAGLDAYLPDLTGDFAVANTPNFDPQHVLFDSGAWQHITGDERALEPSSIRPASADGGIRTAEGHELTAAKQGDMPLLVCGAGRFKGDDRIICIRGVQLYTELPAYRRVVSPGRLESENPNVKIDTLNSCVNLY